MLPNVVVFWHWNKPPRLKYPCLRSVESCLAPLLPQAPSRRFPDDVLREVDHLVGHRGRGASDDVERRRVGRARVRPRRHELLRFLHRVADLLESPAAEQLPQGGEEVLLFFLDVMTDQLRQYLDLGVEALVFGPHAVKLRQRPLHDVVLLEVLQDHRIVLEHLARGRVEDLLLDAAVDGQLLDDLVGDLFLGLRSVRAEPFEPLE